MSKAAPPLDVLLSEIRACRTCITSPVGAPLPHEPRPVLRVCATARLLICGQAPGTRVHASGLPFTDPSGDRLRAWMGVPGDVFYDESRVAILPMGFCFPGLDAAGSDLPPRRECAPLWRAKVLALLPAIELVMLVGKYAFAWHMPERRNAPVTQTVAAWREIVAASRGGPALWPMPHPSWRNSGWLKANPWFEAELVPALQADIARILSRKLA